MPEEICPGIFRIKVPLPNLPLKYVNSYIIKGRERHLLVDTGLNRLQCLQTLQDALLDLQVGPDKTFLFLTHMHSDHSGLAPVLFPEIAGIFANKITAETINAGVNWDELLKLGRMAGLPSDKLEETRDNHPGYKYRPLGGIEYIRVEDGDILNFGDYSFACLSTPGHSHDHMCLYDSKKKILLSGDHIMQEITPFVSQWAQSGNPLQEYLHSLDRVSELEINLVLPGHKSIMRECHSRIQDIKRHHRNRLAEIMRIIGDEKLTPQEVASRMAWDMQGLLWEEAPFLQKWFAVGESLAHLFFLEQKGQLTMQIKDGLQYFQNSSLV